MTQTSSDTPQDQTGDPKDEANRIVDLYQGVDKFLDSLKIPDEERKEVEKNLMEAIAADLLTRLGQKLSEDERRMLAESGTAAGGTEPDLNGVAEFFRGKFTQEELMNTLAESTESVLTEFAETLDRNG